MLFASSYKFKGKNFRKSKIFVKYLSLFEFYQKNFKEI